MTDWIKTQKGNYVDISKAYLLEVGYAQTEKGEEFQIRAFFLTEEGFCIVKTFKTEKEARQYLDGIISKIGYTKFMERKK
jgi:hypothetical protein